MMKFDRRRMGPCPKRRRMGETKTKKSPSPLFRYERAEDEIQVIFFFFGVFGATAQQENLTGIYHEAEFQIRNRA